MTFADVSEGIRAAIAAYAQALDDGRADDVVATFCADGVADLGFGVYEGHAALREAFAQFVPKVPQRHVVANTLVTEWSDNEAKATSDLVFMVKGDAGWSIQLVGRYDDTLRHEDGTWRFARRVVAFL
jgi:hypothetical protein